jgi:hypothetical protein
MDYPLSIRLISLSWIIHEPEILSGKPKRYVNIKVPEELADEIDKVLAGRKLGYRSRAEFIAEATRQRLMEIRKTSKPD